MIFRFTVILPVNDLFFHMCRMNVGVSHLALGHSELLQSIIMTGQTPATIHAEINLPVSDRDLRFLWMQFVMDGSLEHHVP